ncbi:hypothetical protein [Croceicoccus pelagius]|uniref:Uncharacterized protein n=1 Tax=Croceicoccus pelagius TaxID=1703341 RepID=A0A917DPJ0_9SPHN|nr:hypothetical protein [Croceicoccus pelagius]GGD54373.1 hypothetical protein GCM10010989_30670 [Croceicoccus pelagius]
MTTPSTPQMRSQSADLYEIFGAERPNELPQSADNAALISMLFLKLGGALYIHGNGKRAISRPCAGLFSDSHPLPQFPGAGITEQFHNFDEWNGAMKMVNYLFARLHSDDKNFAFDAFALVSVEA